MAKRGWTNRALEMKAKLEELDRSEMTQAAFAKSEGLALSSVVYWRRRIRELEQEDEVGAHDPGLVPVHVIGSKPSSALEVETRGGRIIRIPANFDEGSLARLIRAVESC